MKKLISLITPLIGLSLGWSQNTVVNMADMTPAIGTSQVLHGSEAMPTNFETNGVNVTWDLSNLALSFTDTLEYIAVSDAQNPNLASNADFVIKRALRETFITSINNTFKISATELNFTPYAIKTGNAVKYSFPMQYGNINTHSFNDTLVDENNDTTFSVGTFTQEVLGEGNLITHQGTIEGCLKIRSTRDLTATSSDSPNTSTLKDTIYYWVSPDFTEYIMSIEVVPGSQSGYFTYILDIPTLSTDEFAKNQIKLSPIPSSGIINIENLPVNCELSVIDISGRIVQKTEMTSGNHAIDLSHLEKGSYYLTFKQGKFTEQHKIIIQ